MNLQIIKEAYQDYVWSEDGTWLNYVTPTMVKWLIEQLEKKGKVKT